MNDYYWLDDPVAVNRNKQVFWKVCQIHKGSCISFFQDYRDRCVYYATGLKLQFAPGTGCAFFPTKKLAIAFAKDALLPHYYTWTNETAVLRCTGKVMHRGTTNLTKVHNKDETVISEDFKVGPIVWRSKR